MILSLFWSVSSFQLSVRPSVCLSDGSKRFLFLFFVFLWCDEIERAQKNLWQQINISVSIVFLWYPLPASFRIPLSCNVCRRLFEFVRCDVYAKHYTDQRSLSFGVHYYSYQISRHLHDDHHIECQHYTATDLINTLDVFERKKIKRCRKTPLYAKIWEFIKWHNRKVSFLACCCSLLILVYLGCLNEWFAHIRAARERNTFNWFVFDFKRSFEVYIL